jgi:Ran GTPase-activating protein (RanGAP) involved in mRNA processing and transport
VLVRLRLDFNSIGDGTVMIGNALMHNCALQVLSLQSNGIGPMGVSHIAEGLMRNSCLLSLDLAGNAVQVRELWACGMRIRRGISGIQSPRVYPLTTVLALR